MAEALSLASNVHRKRTLMISWDRFDQLCWLHFERVRQRYDIQQGNISFSPFYSAHVVPMQIRQFS